MKRTVTTPIAYVAATPRPKPAHEFADAECPIEHCGLSVTLSVDRNGVCRYSGGCSHFIQPERWDGKLMAGFADEPA